MILVLLTSHRADCFALCLECLEAHTDLSRFTRIYVIANAPAPAHFQMAKNFTHRHLNAVLVHTEPRGLDSVMAAQEAILQKHTGLTVKLDEDVFVTPGWLEEMESAYQRNRDWGCFLVSALVPNNAVGRQALEPILQMQFPEYAASASLQKSPISQNKEYGIWIWHQFLSRKIKYTPGKVSQALKPRRIELPLSINCIVFDQRMTEAILPFNGEMDERRINLALERESKTHFGVVTPYAVAHHYSFGGQQKAIDSHISLEDIRELLL